MVTDPFGMCGFNGAGKGEYMTKEAAMAQAEKVA